MGILDNACGGLFNPIMSTLAQREANHTISHYQKNPKTPKATKLLQEKKRQRKARRQNRH